MNKHETLKVQLVDRKGQRIRIGRVSVDVIFHIKGNQRYRFDAGRTAGSGACTATYKWFEADRSKNAKLFLMDYNTRLEECDPEILVHLPSIAELKTRYRAAAKWLPMTPRDWLRLRMSNSFRIVADDIRAMLGGRTTTLVHVPCDLVH